MAGEEGVVIPFEARDEISSALQNMAKMAGEFNKAMENVKGTLDRVNKGAQEGQHQVSGFMKAFEGVESVFKKINSYKVGDLFHDVENMSVAGIAVGAGLAEGTKGAAKMENQLAHLSLSSKVTKEDLGALRSTAYGMAGATEISANSIGVVGGKLLKLGLDVKSTVPILESLVKTSGSFGLNMEETANSAIKTTKAFNLGMGTIPETMDVVTKVANETSTSIDSMLGGLSRLGPTARTAGLDIQDTAGLIGAFNAAGMDTEKSVMILQRAMGKAAKGGFDFKQELKDIGQAYQHANTQTEKAMILANAFGPRALAMGTVFEKTGGDIGKMTERFKDSAGAVEKTAEVMDKTTTQMFERMHNRVENAFQRVSEKTLLPLGGVLLKTLDKIPDTIIVGAVGAVSALGAIGGALHAASSAAIVWKSLGVAQQMWLLAGAARAAALGVIALQTAGVALAAVGGYALGTWIYKLIEAHKWTRAILNLISGGVAVDLYSNMKGKEASSLLSTTDIGTLQKSSNFKDKQEAMATLAPILSITSRKDVNTAQRETVKELIREVGQSGMKIDKVEFKLDKNATEQDVEKMLRGLLQRGRKNNPKAGGRIS